MSDTPRTDAQEDIASEWYYKMREAGDPPFDSEQFAFSRTLERELTEARRELGKCAKHVSFGTNESLCAQLTAHKEALEKCERVMRDIDLQVWSHCDVEEALAAIAKCKEGK